VQRNLRWTALLFVLALVVAACGGGEGADTTAAGGEGAVTTAAGGEGTETTAGGEGTATTAGAGGTETTAAGGEAADLTGVELNVMGWSSSAAEDEALTTLLDQFNEETGAVASFSPSPSYDTDLQAALAGGQPPDVFYVDSFRLPDLVEAGALAPPPEGAISDPDDIAPSLREAFTYDGTFYCPPKDFSTLALQYDPAALEAAGVEVPTTWDELRSAAEALTSDDQAAIVNQVEYPRWGQFLFQNGADLTNEDITEMTLDTPEAREALEFIAGMYADGLMVSNTAIDAGWSGEAYGQGKAAMTMEGNWIATALSNEFPDREVAYAELPAGPSGEKGTFAFTVCYGVAANAANPEASWALADYLTNAEGSLAYTEAFNVMPARVSVQEQWIAEHPDLEPFVAGVEYAHKWQFVPGFQDVIDVFNEQAQALVDGSGSVDQLIEETTSAGEDVLGG
jgi:multiple sugar transport system substrate-binding protein